MANAWLYVANWMGATEMSFIDGTKEPVTNWISYYEENNIAWGVLDTKKQAAEICSEISGCVVPAKVQI